MNITFRWYGQGNDTVSLQDVKQIPNVKGIVWGLHHLPAGEVWTKEAIRKEIDYIQSFGFHTDVVESVNVHEDIKLGLNTRDQYIENYKQSIRNLGEAGVKVICYNFMPVFDWTRTDLFHPLEDGSTALYFDKEKVMNLDPQDLVDEISKLGLTMPGWEPERLAHLSELFEQYKTINEEKLWGNLAYFLNAILPIAEEAGIQMAIHPDDPPYSIFGLPRIITGEASYEKLIGISESKANAITYCSGSMGASLDNDMVAIAEKYAYRSPFAHIRNVNIAENGSFFETSHFTSDGSIDITNIVRTLNEQNYSGYVRPDHGRHIWGEKCRPGYGLYDRALGIMYLNGLWDAYENLKKQVQ